MTPDEVAKLIADLERRSAQQEERLKSHEERLRDIEKTQAGILDIRLMLERLSVGNAMGNEQVQKSIEGINTRLDKMDARHEERMASIEKRLDAQEKAPGQKWEKASWLIVTLIIGAVVGWVLNLWIPKIPQ